MILRLAGNREGIPKIGLNPGLSLAVGWSVSFRLLIAVIVIVVIVVDVVFRNLFRVRVSLNNH